MAPRYPAPAPKSTTRATVAALALVPLLFFGGCGATEEQKAHLREQVRQQAEDWCYATFGEDYRHSTTRCLRRGGAGGYGSRCSCRVGDAIVKLWCEGDGCALVKIVSVPGAVLSSEEDP